MYTAPVEGQTIEEIPEHVMLQKYGVIAEGEATGHHHRIETLEAAHVFRFDDEAFVEVGANGVSIVHEEHRSMKLDADTTYKVNRARSLANLIPCNPEIHANDSHKLEAYIRPTCEVVLTESPAHLQKYFDPESGLVLIGLAEAQKASTAG